MGKENMRDQGRLFTREIKKTKRKVRLKHMNKIRRFMGMFIISVCLLSVLSGCDLIDELRSETDVVDYNTTYGIGEGNIRLH